MTMPESSGRLGYVGRVALVAAVVMVVGSVGASAQSTRAAMSVSVTVVCSCTIESAVSPSLASVSSSTTQTVTTSGPTVKLRCGSVDRFASAVEVRQPGLRQRGDLDQDVAVTQHHEHFSALDLVDRQREQGPLCGRLLRRGRSSCQQEHRETQTEHRVEDAARSRRGLWKR